MGNLNKRQPTFCFDRTPLLIGVVILPLAACSVLMAGGLFFSAMNSGRSADAQGQMRIALVERERREENHDVRRGDAADEDQDARQRLTSTPGLIQPTDLQVALAPVPPVPDGYADFSRLIKSPYAPISPRGPPHVA